jgi:hypothetical protein
MPSLNHNTSLMLEALRDLILFSHSQHQQWGGLRSSTSSDTSMLNYLYTHFTLVTERQLESLYNTPQGDLLGTHSFIHLKPYENEGTRYPVLTIKHDFGKFPAELRLRLFIFDVNKNAVGFRFETPESEGEGKHNYYHVQMICTAPQKLDTI